MGFLPRSNEGPGVTARTPYLRPDQMRAKGWNLGLVLLTKNVTILRRENDGTKLEPRLAQQWHYL